MIIMTAKLDTRAFIMGQDNERVIFAHDIRVGDQMHDKGRVVTVVYSRIYWDADAGGNRVRIELSSGTVLRPYLCTPLHVV